MGDIEKKKKAILCLGCVSDSGVAFGIWLAWSEVFKLQVVNEHTGHDNQCLLLFGGLGRETDSVLIRLGACLVVISEKQMPDLPVLVVVLVVDLIGDLVAAGHFGQNEAAIRLHLGFKCVNDFVPVVVNVHSMKYLIAAGVLVGLQNFPHIFVLVIDPELGPDVLCQRDGAILGRCDRNVAVEVLGCYFHASIGGAANGSLETVRIFDDVPNFHACQLV